ncbi:hypothetical protein INT43_000217, partial [Umbelopsis isabellina]
KQWLNPAGEPFAPQFSDQKAFLILAGLSTWKYAVSCTAEELVSVVTLYCKAFNVIMLYYYGKKWWMMLYIIGWALIFVLFPQPPYQGTTKAVELSSSSLTKVLENKQANAKIVELDEDEQPLVDVPMAKYWVILLYANWSVASRNFEAVLAGLSLRYDGPNIKFGKVDIDLYPAVASKYHISGEAAAFDLPTLILFKDGKELTRLPQLVASQRAIKGKNTTTELSRKDAAKDTISRIGWNRSPVSEGPLVLIKRISVFNLKLLLRHR